jgi:hypothetical protein
VGERRLRILILYDPLSTHTQTVIEHLRAFALYSKNEVSYAAAARDAKCTSDLSLFDAVVIHYSIRLCFPDFIAPEHAQAVAAFRGLKVLFIQDEYDFTETARTWIERLGIDVLYTCVPPESAEHVYPRARFPKLELITTLTGFVPPRFEQLSAARPIKERSLAIGYRGRALPYWYGSLAHEKLYIGQKMRAICEERNIRCDIEWEDDKRIYGDAWYDFLASCKATLGTESGANVFDDHGTIRGQVVGALEENPQLTFEEAFAKYVAPHEGKVRMNQISPKVFEAIALKTALILFRGEYSGVVQPDLHYIPLEKDFSNIDEVLRKLSDDTLLQTMVDRAHTDVIASSRYSYRQAIADFDAVLERRAVRRANIEPFTVLLGVQSSVDETAQIMPVSFYATMSDVITSAPLLRDQAIRPLHHVGPPSRNLARALWLFFPRTVRSFLRTLFVPMVKPILDRIWARRPNWERK